jgi:ELWxxDGT repeat protein
MADRTALLQRLTVCSFVLLCGTISAAATQLTFDSGGALTTVPYPELVNVNGTLFFAKNGTSNAELWKSDGTVAGTVLVKDIDPTFGGSSPDLLTPYNGELYFIAWEGSQIGLYHSNGEAAGTARVAMLDILPQEMKVSGGKLFLDVSTQGASDRELYVYDAGSGNLSLVKNINPSNRSFPQSMIDVNGTLFFVADHPTYGEELWKSDGTEAGTVLVKDVAVGTGDSAISDYCVINGILYFSAVDAAFDRELWRSDGTDAGTYRVRNIHPTGSAFVDDLVAHGNTLFFYANNGTIFGMWAYNTATDSLQFVKTLLYQEGMALGANVFINEQEPTFVNATSYSDFEIDINPTNLAFPRYLTKLPGEEVAVFAATHSSFGEELWRTDGTAAGTRMVVDIVPGAEEGRPYQITISGSHIFFACSGLNGGSGTQLYCVPLASAEAPKLRVEDLAVIEGATATLSVNLTAPAITPVTVAYSAQSGSATAADFSLASGVVTFQAGEMSKTVNVSTANDAIDEDDEAFTFTLQNATGAAIQKSAATITIQDNDLPPAVSVTSTSLREGDGASTVFSLAVNLSGASGKSVGVSFNTADGSALAGTHYTSNSGTLAFAPGETQKLIELSVFANALEEPDRTFSVALTSPVNASIGASPATISIIDDDAALQASALILAPSPATAGRPVSVTFPVVDPDGFPILKTYDYGDGFSDGSGTHTYAAAGTFNVKVIAEKSVHAVEMTGSLTVLAIDDPGADPDGDGIINNLDGDDDNDSLSDVLEASIGTNPFTASADNSAQSLFVKTAAVSLNFAKPGKDSFKMNVEFSAGAETQKPAELGVFCGDYGARVTLDSKGKSGKGTSPAVRVTLSRGVFKISASVKNSALADEFASFGLVDKDSPRTGEETLVPVGVVYPGAGGDTARVQIVTMIYKGRLGKTGKAAKKR